jgi:hypothetical protein
MEKSPDDPRIEVGRVAFVSCYTGPGAPSAKALTSPKVRRDSKHEVFYLPALRMFEVVYSPPDPNVRERRLVPVERIDWWETLEECLARGR